MDGISLKILTKNNLQRIYAYMHTLLGNIIINGKNIIKRYFLNIQRSTIKDPLVTWITRMYVRVVIVRMIVQVL